MREWQPISTAPKDETDILVAGGSYGCECVACEFHNVKFKRVHMAHWDQDDKRFVAADNYYFYPTHWMPLPVPPKP